MVFVITLQYLLLLVLSEGINGDGHPNLGLLPEECGFINVKRQSESKFARLYEFPWIVNLLRVAKDSSKEFIILCSGTVINERYVLTGARCATNKPTRVIIGDYDRQQDSDCEGQGSTMICEDTYQEIEIEKITKHENFRRYQNNIALLRLKTPIDFSQKNAAAVCLPITTELQNKSLEGQEAIIAGWELPLLTIKELSISKMYKLHAPILTNEECSLYLLTKAVPDICTDMQNVCTLIAGSPLMLPSAVHTRYRYVQYGFLHFRMASCEDFPWTSYFVDIRKYVNWILDNLKA